LAPSEDGSAKEEDKDETGSSYTVTGSEDEGAGGEREGEEDEGEEEKTEWSWAAPPAVPNGAKEEKKRGQEGERCVGCEKEFEDKKARFLCAVCEGWKICCEVRLLSPSFLVMPFYLTEEYEIDRSRRAW
jgi:hypothetical protein